MEEFTATRRMTETTTNQQQAARFSPQLQYQQQVDDPYNRAKFKGVNKFEETTKQVMALSIEKRRIL